MKSNYKILDLVGRGQFGRVYAAIERQSGMLVALKELNIKQLSTSNFLRELTFLVTLDHFNIVTCRAIEHKQNKRYLVMDYCEGGTLRDLIDRAPRLSLTQSLQLVIDVLYGLEFAHARGIIHRDIKPENILLKSSERGYSAHIADFGIAQLNQQLENTNVLGNTGSPAYMAPEQFYGDYSYNCDLYGLGIILYELVVGERPFLGLPKDLLAGHLSRPVVIPSDVPLILRLVIAKALLKFPQYRFQTAAEMRQSLQLVREIFEANAQTETSRSLETACTTVAADLQLNFDLGISYLATARQEVVLGTGDRSISSGNLELEKPQATLESRKITFDEPIGDLQVSASGCLVTTTSSLYYQSQTKSADTGFLPIATFATTKIVSSVDPQGSWLAVAYQTQDRGEARLKIYQLPQGKLKQSLADCDYFDRLIALDRRHALGLSHKDRDTRFQLFNRRGNWLANFSVRVRLDIVVYNSLFADRLLAREVDNPNTVIALELKKFNLRRIQLQLEVASIAACPLGYLVSDRQGQMMVLNCDGKCLCKFQVSLTPKFTVTAIAVSNSQLLVASTDSTQSRLQTFAWSKIISLQLG